jgi:putative DNA primase/helicase
MTTRTFSDYGIDVRGAYGGEVRTTCPQCSASRRKATARCLSVNVGKGCWYCHHCGMSGGLKRDGVAGDRANIAKLRAKAEAERAVRYAQNLQRVERLWSAGAAVQTGDAVGQYLARRGIALDIFPADLRLAALLPYYDADGTRIAAFPAMLAAVRTLDNKLVAVHRTHLTHDGRKAPVDPVRKLSAVAGPLMGAAVRLAPVRAGVLGVAEGVETALAASLASGVPVWSAISAAGLQAFLWPRGLTRLFVFGDNDESATGQEAAERLAHRARAAGLAVTVMIPPIAGIDWADAWAASRIEAAA